MEIFIIIVISLLLVVGSCTLSGYITKKRMDEKGYNGDDYFWKGFFFGSEHAHFIPPNPERNHDSKRTLFTKFHGETDAQKQARMKADIMRAGGWECAFCGRAINKFFGSCGCGKTKAETIEKLQELKAQEVVAKASEVPEAKNSESVTAETDEAKNIEMIVKYKELLDSGAITQDEYDKKKSEILGL